MAELIVGPKYRGKGDGYRTFSIRIKEETVQKLEQIAGKTGRSRNELIGLFLEFAVDNCSVEEKEEP